MVPMSGNQFEFWRTYKDPGQFTYPPANNVIASSLVRCSTISGAGSQTHGRYYVRKLTDVSFTEEVGLQTLSYTELDIYDQAFTLYIEMQPLEGSVVLCKRINNQLFIIGTDNRDDGN